jgi:uncharacterized membrane protein YphA (DoxX/SURF4 family)
MGLNHFLQTDQMSGYAGAKGLPAPRASVLLSGGLLVFGGLGLVAGVLPVLAAGALVTFLLVSAVTMHDFWAADDPEATQQEMTEFLKNVGLAGGALALLALGGTDWPLALGVTLF